MEKFVHKLHALAMDDGWPSQSIWSFFWEREKSIW
jgi:hypothetical protein